MPVHFPRHQIDFQHSHKCHTVISNYGGMLQSSTLPGILEKNFQYSHLLTCRSSSSSSGSILALLFLDKNSLDIFLYTYLNDILIYWVGEFCNWVSWNQNQTNYLPIRLLSQSQTIVKPKPNQLDYLPFRLLSQSQTIVKPKTNQFSTYQLDYSANPQP